MVIKNIMTKSFILKSQTSHLTEVSTEKIINLQYETSLKLGLKHYFSAPLKIGGTSPKLLGMESKQRNTG